jgi:soluble cytochrome b562
MKVALVLAALLLAAAIALLLLRRRPSTPTEMSTDDIQHGMHELAAVAVDDAKAAHGVTLDYSLESVESVERILSTYHQQGATSENELRRLQQLGIRYGAYVGEAIRRRRGGHWERDHVAAGPGSFPLTTSRGQSFPIGWCTRRIKNGPEDCVWHKVQVLFIQMTCSPSLVHP